MDNTLLSDLKAVESIPRYLRIDKAFAYKDVIEKWCSLSPMVKDAADGKLSIYQEFEGLYNRIGGIRSAYPHHVAESDLEKTEEFKKILGRIAEDFELYLLNPVSGLAAGGILAGSISALYDIGKTNDKKITRRQFLRKSFETAALGASVMGCAGLVASCSRESHMQAARINARYVQDKIEEIQDL